MCYFKTTFNNIKTTLSKIHSNIYYIGLVGFFMNFAATMIYTTMIFVVGGKDNIMSESSVVAIRNIAEALGNLSKIFSGYISDKIQNRKGFLLIGYGAMLLTKAGFTFLTFRSFFPFSIIFFQIFYTINQNVDRIMNAIRDPARDAILMECSKVETRGISYGLRKFITSFGSILSGIFTGCLVYFWQRSVPNSMIFKYGLFPVLMIMAVVAGYLTKKIVPIILISLLMVLLGSIANYMPFPSLLYITSLLPVVLVIMIIKYLVKEPKRISGEKKYAVDFSLIRNNLGSLKKVWLLLAIICFLTLGKLNEFFVFTVGTNYFSMSKHTIPFMFTIMYVCVTLMSTVFGVMIDKKQSFFVLFLTIVCLLLGNYCIYTAKTLVVFWIGLILISTFLAASDSAIASIISFLIPDPKIKATIYGIFYGISGLLGIVNAFLVKVFENSWNIKEMYGLSMIPIFVSLIILILSSKYFQQNLNEAKTAA